MSDERRTTLSASGAARKEAIFLAMVSAQRRRSVRRRAVQIGGSALVLTAVGISAWAALRPASTGQATQRVSQAPAAVRETNPADRRPLAGRMSGVIQIVGNDPTVVTRLSVRADPGRVGIIDDSELDRYLVRAGRAPGFVRTPDRWILAADIPAPRLPQPGSG